MFTAPTECPACDGVASGFDRCPRCLGTGVLLCGVCDAPAALCDLGRTAVCLACHREAYPDDGGATAGMRTRALPSHGPRAPQAARRAERAAS